RRGGRLPGDAGFLALPTVHHPWGGAVLHGKLRAVADPGELSMGSAGVPASPGNQAAAPPRERRTLAGMTDPHDFLAVDGLLSDEDRAIRDTVRVFADKELAPHV